MPNATFVSSADRKATRSAGELGKALSRFSLLHAKLCAERPRLIVLLLLATLAWSPWIGRSDEPVKLAFATATAFSPAATLSTNKVALRFSSAATNSLSLSLAAGQPVGNPASPANTNTPAADLLSTVRVPVVIEKTPEPGGWFYDQSGNGSFGIFNIQAGYGQAYDCDSIVLRGRNGTGWEETRYVFFKKVVKF